MTITCAACGKTCSGEVLKVQDRHFHIECFTCKALCQPCQVCGAKLLSGGYFLKNEEYYCSKDYHVLYGTKCKVCSKYVEGRVVTALGHSYHPHCFTCDRCKEEICSGTVVTYNDCQEILCQKCTDVAFVEEQVDHTLHGSRDHTPRPMEQLIKSDDEIYSSRSSPSLSSPLDTTDHNDSIDFSKLTNVDSLTRSRLGKCAGCREVIKSCQSLIALERHWHLFCFVCYHCQNLLNKDYMTEDEKPYCLECYNNMYGALCEVCGTYITGKVIQAGEKYFHTACAHCQRCSNGFNDGEEMCISGEFLWHLSCDFTPGSSMSIPSYHNRNSRTGSERKDSTSSESHTTSGPASPRTRSSTHLESENESSELQIFPLKDIQLIGNIRLPKNVDRTRLENHISDEDFMKCLGVTRDVFRDLPRWKQVDLKKRANLF